MVRSVEQIKEDLKNKAVRSVEQIKKDVQDRSIFASGVDKVMMDERLQSFLTADVDEDTKYKLANSLYFSNTYKQPFNQVYQNYDGIALKLFGPKKPKDIYKDIQWASMSDKQKFAAYDKDATFWKKTEDWYYKTFGVDPMKRFAGIIEADADLSAKLQTKIFGKPTELNQKIGEWSRDMRAGVQLTMKENPGMFVNPAGDNFWDTTKRYISNPEYILFGAAEQVPLILASMVTGGAAGAAAKGVGLGAKAVKTAAWLGRVEGFAIPLFGDRYSDLRSQNIPPEQAFGEAFLAAQAEGLLEEWTLAFNIGLFKGAGTASKRSMSRYISKWLLDKPWYVKTGAYVGSVYAQGASEEGLQQISDNFWAMTFRDTNRDLLEGVGQQAAAGGLLELAMGTGFKVAGKIFNPNYVSEEEQLARLDVIREKISEAPLNEKARTEVNQYLDNVETAVTEGKWPEPKEGEVKPVAEQAQPPAPPAGEGKVDSELKPVIISKKGKIQNVNELVQQSVQSLGENDVRSQNERTGGLADSVRGFIQSSENPEHIQRVLIDGEWSRGTCETIARELVNYLSKQGIKANVIGLKGFKGDFGKRASKDWIDFVGKDNSNKQYLWHAVVQVGEDFVDITGSQYGEGFSGIRILTREQVSKEWSSAEIHPSQSERDAGKKPVPVSLIQPPAPPAEAKIEPATIDEKLGMPESNQVEEVADEIKRTERYGIQEAEGKWIVKDWETQQEISVHDNSREALQKSIGLNKGEIEARKPRSYLPISEKITLTVRKILNYVMKGEERQSRQVYMQAARDIVGQHKQLARYANNMLIGLDITKQERSALLRLVAEGKTEAEKVAAIAIVQKIRNDSLKREAIGELRQIISYINSKVGKNMYENGIRPEYYEKIQAITNGLTEKKISDKTKKRIESLVEYLEQVRSEAQSRYEVAYIESLIPKALMDKIPLIGLRNIDSMSLDELRNTSDILRRLIHLNKLKTGIIRGQLASNVADMLDSAMEEAQELPARPQGESTDFSREPHKENWFSFMLNLFAVNRNHDIETLSETISSGKFSTINNVTAEGLSRARLGEAKFSNEWEDIINKTFTENKITLEDLQEFSDYFFRTIKGPKLRKKINLPNSKKYSVSIGGKKFDVNMDDLMDIYMHAQSVDYNLPALINEGIAKNVPLGKLTYSELEAISDIVESNKKAMALIGMTREVLDYGAKKINDISLLLDGVELAKLMLYWHVERYSTGGVAGRQTVRNSLLESMGYLHEREGSDRPVVIYGLFDALFNYQQMIAQYYGLAIPLRTIKNLLNYRPLRHLLINEKGYEKELKMIDVLIERTEQKPKSYSETDQVVNSIINGLARSVLSEPGIMLGQWTSTMFYFSEVDPKYATALRLFATKADIEKYKKHNPIFRRRAESGINSVATHQAKQADLLLRAYMNKDEYANYLTKGLQYFDIWALVDGARLVEAEMADKNLSGESLGYWRAKGIDPSRLKYGSEEYWKAHTDRWNFIVRRTQSMFFTENRSVLTSGETKLEKSLYLFRSAIDQPLRILYRTINDYRRGRTTKKSLLKSFAAVYVGLASYEAIRFALNKTLYRDDDDETDLILQMLISPIKILNIVGYPISRLIEAVVDYRFKGEPFNLQDLDYTPLAGQFINDAGKASIKLTKGLIYLDTNEKFISGPHKRRLKSEVYLEEGAIDAAKLALRFTGVPTRTIENFIVGKGKPETKKGLKP